MKKILTLTFLLAAITTFAQVKINDSTDTESFKVFTGTTFRGTYPKGSAFIDVDASSRLGIKLLSGSQIVSYNTFSNFIINGVTPSNFAQAHQLLSDVLGIQCCGSSGGSSQGLNSFQFSDGNGGFYEFAPEVPEHGQAFLGLDPDFGAIMFGLNNTVSSYFNVLFGSSNASTSPLNLTTGSNNTNNGEASFMGGEGNINNAYLSLVSGLGNVNNSLAGVALGMHSITTSNDPTLRQDSDTVLVYGNGEDENDRSNALTLQRNGNLAIKGVYSSIAYQNYTSGGNVSIPDNISLFIYNPSSTESSATITLPANPIDGQITTIAFGGSVSSGTVVTTLSLSTTGGQTINVGTAAANGMVENPLTFQFVAPLNKWYLVNN